MGGIKFSVLVILSVIAFSCGKRERLTDDSPRSLYESKYVYVSADKGLHYDPECINIQLLQATGDVVILSPVVERVEKNNIPDSLFKRCCTRCINDTIYESLRKQSGSRIKAPWVK